MISDPRYVFSLKDIQAKTPVKLRDINHLCVGELDEPKNMILEIFDQFEIFAINLIFIFIGQRMGKKCIFVFLSQVLRTH